MIVFIPLATMNCTHFCMEIQNEYLQQLLFRHLYLDDMYKELKCALRKNIVDNYSTVHPAQQYKMLRACIECNDMGTLSLCLTCKFNPNRYHKNLSLLHYAIQYHKPQAIVILSRYNPDLIPLNNEKQTPLNYAIYLECTDCINAMVYIIKRKYNELRIYRKHCGLTKHIINPEYPCSKCINELRGQLKWHSLSDPCTSIIDLEEANADLQS